MNAATRGAVVLAILVACSGDNKAKDKGELPPEPAPTDAPIKPIAAKAPPAPEPVKTPGKVVPLELSDIGGRDKPLVLQVPEGTEVSMQDVDSEEVLPWAKLQAGALEITVESPESGMFTLAQEKGMVSRGNKDAKFVYEAKVEGGWELIVERNGKFDATVSHTKLAIACGCGELRDRATADKILEICRTVKSR